MNDVLERAIAETLGVRVLSSRPLSGGSINEAYAVELDGHAPVFVKHHAGCDRLMFEVEAKGLEWLREADALRIPNVIAVADADQPAFLVMELLSPATRAPDFAERLGRGLAELHRFGADDFGLAYDNFIGSLPQANQSADSWSEFYWSQRLEPQIKMAAERGYLAPGDLDSFDALRARLSELCGPTEPPARLHGDLWGGNLHVDDSGAPCLIDPAVYGGHREVDLAMMQLFGGFESRVFDAYDESFPLYADWRERTPLYQLYYLLVHVNLFGRGYLGQTRAALAHYL